MASSSFKDRSSENKPKSTIGKMIVEIDNEDDILSLEYDNYRELMDQLHPLREAELVDIFPAMKIFMILSKIVLMFIAYLRETLRENEPFLGKSA